MSKVYTFHFDLSGSVDIEADSLEEAKDLFNEIDDYSEHVNPSDVYGVVIDDEDGDFIEEL